MYRRGGGGRGVHHKECDFALHMDRSNADSAPHIEGSRADFAPHIERRHSLRDQKNLICYFYQICKKKIV